MQPRTLGWWYWLATALLLAGSLAGWEWARAAVLLLCGVQLMHFRLLEGSAAAFPVQVRVAFLALLLAGMWEPLRFLHWVQLCGTTAFVLSGYCLLARLLSLLPGNRREPWSRALLARVLLSPPQRGNVLQGLPAEASCCRREAAIAGGNRR